MVLGSGIFEGVMKTCHVCGAMLSRGVCYSCDHIECLKCKEYVDKPTYDELEKEVARLKSLLNAPETEDFDKGVPLEAAHQIERWGADHDTGKEPEDWFWLCGYLAGKALAAMKLGDKEKAKHHCISTAAAMRNWHKHIATGGSQMRPGISAAKAAIGGAQKL
jgi:hypothetical protein